MKRCGRGGGGSRRRDVTGRESLLWCENTYVKVLLKLKWGPKSQQEEEEEVPKNPNGWGGGGRWFDDL
jgi:hypothetical protein